MRRIGFVLRRDTPEASALAAQLVPWLTSLGHELYAAGPTVPGVRVVSEATFAQHIDLLIVLGGDGTLLAGAALVGEAGVPVLGINLGRLGFLAPFQPGQARQVVERALAGEIPVEERMRLRVRILRGGQVIAERTALNDAVIAQGAMARLVDLGITLDGAPVTTHRADGLIICTPTGSTAYNLSAGGPILPPGQGAFVLTPICPHTLTQRPLVVSSRARIGVLLSGASQGIMLTVDGQWAHPLAAGDQLEITKAAAGLKLFRGDTDYFAILREKLKWGEA